MDPKLTSAIETLWEYMQCHQAIRDADCMIVIGSLNDEVARYAARVERQHTFPYVVVSGGNSRLDKMSELNWEEPTEADHLLACMRSVGYARTDTLMERRAANTGQNATYTYELLHDHGYIVKSICIVTKPYLERRALATFEAQWPDKTTAMQVPSPGGTFQEYCRDYPRIGWTINVMVGDMQRIIEYPKLGMQTSQDIPDAVMEAYELLKASGFTQHLIKHQV